MSDESITEEVNNEPPLEEEFTEAEKQSKRSTNLVIHEVEGEEEENEPYPTQPEEAIQQEFMTIDLPYTDDQGNEVMRRITVPVVRRSKEKKYKIIKRKRMVPRGRRGSKEGEEEMEEEYEACVLVEIVTKTVLIRDVKEGGNVEEREEDFKEEYLIGKERKFKLVKVEKTDDEGKTYEVDEIEVESEIEDDKSQKRKRRRRRILVKQYDSKNEFIGENYECEWTDEEEGRVREEFSHIEEEQAKEIPAEEAKKEEEIILEDLEWKAIDEILREGEEEESAEEEAESVKEEIPKETSFERERKKQKVSFYKLMKLFLNEIDKRKVLMRDLKLLCHLTGVEIQSPGKEFDENPQKFIDQEAADVEALTKHLLKIYDQYKEEEETYKKEIKEVQTSTEEHLEQYKNLLYEMINDSDQKVMQRLTKGKDLKKTVDEIFKYEELLSKEYVKKAICTLNIEQIKYLLFTEIDQSHLPDEEKEVDPFELDKLIKAFKNFENEALEDRNKLEVEQKKLIRILEEVTCKRREADYIIRKEEEFLKRKPEIEKTLDEREKLYWKLKNYFKDWQEGFQKSLKEDVEQRFPAIHANQKKMDAKGLAFVEIMNSLKRHCPNNLKRRQDQGARLEKYQDKDE